MIKGQVVILHPNIKTLLWHANKPTTVVIRSCQAGVRVGDTNVTVDNGFRLSSQEYVTFSLATNDDLYAISGNGCAVNVMAQSP